MPVPRSHRHTFAALAVGVAVAVALCLASASRAAEPSLYVNYVPNCTFTFTGDNGGAVTSISPGTYQVVVFTPFAFGNGNAACEYVELRITGPGVNFYTDLGGGDEESEQHTVTFQAGATYTVQDDAHLAQTRRTFTVANSGTPTATAGSAPTPTSSSPSTPTSSPSSKPKGTPSQDPVGSAIKPFRGILDAIVSSTGKLTLKQAKQAVSIIKSGRYTIKLVDSSSTAGFTVQIAKGAPKTLSTPKFTGSRSISLTLNPGQWLFYTPKGVQHFFVVSRR